MRARNLWAGVTLALAMGTGLAQTPLPNKLGHVNDLAGAMSSEMAGQLGDTLSAYAAATGIRVAVLTVESAIEESPEELAGRALAILLRGDAAQRGAILLWTANGHVVVYIGEGLRTMIPDRRAQAIIDEAVVPAAAAGDVDNALALGAFHLLQSAMSLDEVADDPAAESAPLLPHRAASIAIPQRAVTALEQDLRGLARAFSEDPLSAASGFFASVQAQAQALPATVSEHLPLIQADADSLVFLCIAAAVLVIGLTVIWRATRSLPVTGCALAMAAAAAIWLPTGFTELSLLVLLAGPVGLIAWLMLGRSRTAAAGTDAARQGTQQSASAAWLAQQQARQAALRASAHGARPTSPTATAVKAVPAPAGAAQPPSPALQRMSELLQRAHAAGTATPAMDRVVARWRTISSAEYKPQRIGMVLTLIVLALFFLPLGFVIAGGWVFWELNALKQPNQKLGEFLQQLSREGQALQHFKSHH